MCDIAPPFPLLQVLKLSRSVNKTFRGYRIQENVGYVRESSMLSNLLNVLKCFALCTKITIKHPNYSVYLITTGRSCLKEPFVNLIAIFCQSFFWVGKLAALHAIWFIRNTVEFQLVLFLKKSKIGLVLLLICCLIFGKIFVVCFLEMYILYQLSKHIMVQFYIMRIFHSVKLALSAKIALSRTISYR